MKVTELLGDFYGMEDFAHGKTSAIMKKVENGRPAFVTKRGKFYRVIITPEDYKILEDAQYGIRHEDDNEQEGPAQ